MEPWSEDPSDAVAVVGMAGRFPGARDLEQFWENLRNGKESITFFSDEELLAVGTDPQLLRNPSFVKAYGMLEGHDLFDASFFGFSPREAAVLDPQDRQFLECAWEALEDAGCDPERTRASIGVFAGEMMNTYLLFNLALNPEVIRSVGWLQMRILNDRDFLTTHVSYKLNLRGPSVAVQTACSTSLVAIHLARESLLDHQCDVALAGGVSIQVPQKTGYLYREGSIVSPDGHCRAFDAAARGTVGGSGVGVVVLKRLEDALAAGDRIRAVLRGSAINNDGSSKVGFTAPSVDAQAEVVTMALEVAGVDPETVTYVEAHGTGTQIGDPVEVAALTRAFRAFTGKTEYCALGSVKSNIGHLDPAAGVAGLIKTVLALERGEIPPTLHFERPNPEIDFAASPFYVASQLIPWQRNGHPHRAGVSSLGVGGTNCHVVLEEAPPAPPSGLSRPWQLLALSARTSAALDRLGERLVVWGDRHPEMSLPDAAFTLLTGRRHFSHRRFVVCRDLADGLSALARNDLKRVFTSSEAASERPVVFLFPGQGSQHIGMARELYASESTFRAEVDRACEILVPHLQLDLREILYAPAEAAEAAERLEQTRLTQPALFVIEHALARLWMEWGVRPQAMIGHSVGEYVAACLAGVLSLEDALGLVALRARLMQRMQPGSMLSVALSEDRILPRLSSELALAAVNAPSLTVVAGPTPAVEALAERLAAEGVETKRLHVSHAFHSLLMEPVLEPFTAAVARLRLRAPEIPYISNLTGTWITAAEATSPEYWGRHLRETVRFASGIATLLQERDRLFLEVGPGNTLGTLVRRNRNSVPIVSSLPGPQEDRSDFEAALQALGRLWLAGARIDWDGFYSHEKRRRTALPTYPFEAQRYWIEPRARLAAVEDEAAGWLSTPIWKRGIRPHETALTGTRSLVVSADRARGDELAAELARGGATVTLAMPGEAPAEAPDRIVVLASPGEDGLAELAAVGAALQPASDRDSLPVAVVTHGAYDVTGEEPADPEAAALAGSVRALAASSPGLRWRNVDLPLSAAGGWPPGLAGRLSAELAAGTDASEVALRGRQRWVRTLENLPPAADAAGQAFAEHGGEIEVLAGDPAVAADVERALAEAVGRLGTTGGLVWCPAGPFDLARAREIAAAGEALEPEVAGFCLLVSPAAGDDTATAAADAFLDAWAEERNRSGARWMRLRWHEAGAGEPPTGAEIAAAVRAALAARTEVLVAELAALRKALAGEASAETQAALPTYERPHLATPYVPARNDVERQLCTIWQEILGLDLVGIHDNFLELGGHSLLATQVMARIREALRVELSTSRLSEVPTVAELAVLIAEQPQLSAEAANAPLVPPIVPDPQHRHEPFPLTDVQQAYWIGRSGAFDLGDVATHFYFEIDSQELDIERFTRAWRRLIDRHGMLRSYVLPDGRQQMLETVPPYEIEILDLRGLDPDTAAARLDEVREHMAHQVVPHDRWPLFEIRATRRDGGWTRLHFSIDLLIADAWSFSVLERDLARLYEDPDVELPELQISFRDYVLTELALRETETYRRALEYWRGRMATLPPGPELPVLKGNLERQYFVRRHGELDAGRWEQIKRRAARAGLSQPGVLLAVFSEVLATWSKSSRFAITLTMNNRFPGHYQVDDIVGDFTSLILLEIELLPDQTFEAHGQRIQKQLWRDLDHRFVSGVRVLRELASRSPGGATGVMMPVVFTSTLNFGTQRTDRRSAFGLPGRNVYSISQTPQIWIDHQVGEDQTGRLLWVWDTVDGLFPPGIVDHLFDSYTRVLERLGDDDSTWEATGFALVPEEQLARRRAVNDTAGPLPEGLLHRPFLEQAMRAPERVAVISPQGELTYGELATLSRRLAHHLRAAGARPGLPVAVVMEKGWEQVAAVIGILEAGAPYVPVDPSLPRERLWYLLAEVEAEIVLTQSRLEELVEWPEGIARLAVDSLDRAGSDPGPLEPLQTSDDLAYIIFTSGSTGRPKGVMIEHRSALNTIADINHRFAVGPDDRVFMLSALNFDLSVYDIFGLLATGGAVVIPEPDAVRDPALWLDCLERAGVTFWDTVPALMQMLVEHAEGSGRELPASLRLCLLSGDWIPVDLPDRICALARNVRVVSGGGATEGSIWSILYPIERVDPAWQSIPYGRPMTNQQFYVLDQALGPRPDWVVGELYIGGAGVARGYWRDEEKTQASFVRHPVTGERLYRTGDLGRYLPDGTIEFLGREDTQVKIQGFRIELGEIEAALREHPAVSAALVAALGEERGNKRLAAYVVPAPGSEVPAAELRDFLAGKLPRYMVPTAFVTLDALPLSPNGKVDRRALPAPDEVVQRTPRELVGPRTPVEEAVLESWTQVLGRDQFGITDNFFELGGDSILATRVVLQLQSTFPIQVPLRTLFEAPTVSELAAVIEEKLLLAIESLSEEEVEQIL